MKSIRRTAAALLAATLLAWAPGARAAMNFVSPVAFVYPLSDGSFIVGFTQPSAACTDPFHYFRVFPGQNGVTPDGVKTMLATSLLAFAMAPAKTLSVVFDETTANCYINRMSIQ